MTPSPEKSALLPRLNPHVRLYPAPYDADGSPCWTLHNPVSGEHYRIGWASFECLARFGHYSHVSDLVDAINRETTLNITAEDVYGIIQFLDDRGLLELQNGANGVDDNDASCKDARHVKGEGAAAESLFKKIMHGYLYFTLPLIKPDDFLTRTLPIVKPFLSRLFVAIMMVNLCAAVLYTMPRADEFFMTFSQMFTVNGAVLALLVFAGLKVLHEMAHAYTAKKYGVSVPHMGVAFIVLYPVLYTETTAGWQLSSARARLHIGMAGILAELSAAGMMLWLWHYAPEGSALRSVCFTGIVISLAGSLLVNLNPLMRFDGYYMLSDVTGIDNLQHRACAFARYHLRRFLFADQTAAPEMAAPARARFLSMFGFALLVYRFFLFLGIAILVYMIFPKPLGAILMVVELYFFIMRPILSEMRIWWARRGAYWGRFNTSVTISAVAVMLILCALPMQRQVQIPAALHAAEYSALYPAAAGVISAVNVQGGDAVKAGQVLIRLESPSLRHDIALEGAKLSALEGQRRRYVTDRERDAAEMVALEEQIELTKIRLTSLKKQAEHLTLTAPFDGVVADMAEGLVKGRSVSAHTMLMRIINPQKGQVTAYADDIMRARLMPALQGGQAQAGDALFFTHTALRPLARLSLSDVADSKAPHISFPELLSVYGGDIAAQAARGQAAPQSRIAADEGGGVAAYNTVRSLYPVRLDVDQINMPSGHGFSTVLTGYVRVRGRAQTVFSRAGEAILRLFQRERGLN